MQAQLTGSGEMHGELTTTITAGSELIRVVEEAKRAVKLAGQYVANGVGSTGKSSPVATAPAHAGSGEYAPMSWLRRPWKRRQARLDALADRLHRVAIRQCVNELLLATTTGFVMRFVGEHLRTQILTELRRSVTARGVVLQMEEQAARLIDQIEHLARLQKTTDTTRH